MSEQYYCHRSKLSQICHRLPKCHNTLFLICTFQNIVLPVKLKDVRNNLQGRIQDFHLGGGAQKIMCPHVHYERRTELTFGRGLGPLSGPWKL